MKKLKIGVVGLGKLGLPLSLVLAKAGFQVTGVDIDEHRISKIRQGRFHEPQVSNYLKILSHRTSFTTQHELLEDAEVVIVITQTPSRPNGFFDTSSVEEAVRQIQAVNKDCLIIISSNVNIGTTGKLRKIHSRIGYSPEWVALGSVISGFEDPKFTVIGCYDREDNQLFKEIWREVHPKPIIIVKPIEAEIIKLAGNVIFTLGITFANLIGELCGKFNADPNQVLNVIYRDRRNYKPGLGFGGPCFQRDVNCFRALCLEEQLQSGVQFADVMNQLNNYTVDRWVEEIKSVADKSVGVLGVAYKPNVPYVYESQSLKITQKLLENSYKVYVYDPLAEENARQVLDGNVHFCKTKEECVEKVEVLFVGTPNFKDVKTGKPVINPWK